MPNADTHVMLDTGDTIMSEPELLSSSACWVLHSEVLVVLLTLHLENLEILLVSEY